MKDLPKELRNFIIIIYWYKTTFWYEIWWEFHAASVEFNAAKKEHHDILETNQKAFGGLASSWHEWR